MLTILCCQGFALSLCVRMSTCRGLKTPGKRLEFSRVKLSSCTNLYATWINISLRGRSFKHESLNVRLGMNNWTECYYLTDQRVPAMVYQQGKKKNFKRCGKFEVKHFVVGKKKNCHTNCTKISQAIKDSCRLKYFLTSQNVLFPPEMKYPVLFLMALRLTCGGSLGVAKKKANWEFYRVKKGQK